MLCKLEKIKDYEFTRDLILKNINNQQELIVFDDTDLESDKFDFLQVGRIYDYKILLLARNKSEEKLYRRKAQEFTVLGIERIGRSQGIKIKDKFDNIFYITDDFANEITNNKIQLIPLRYDILQVDNIVR